MKTFLFNFFLTFAVLSSSMLYSLDLSNIELRILIFDKSDSISVKTGGKVIVEEEKTKNKFLLVKNAVYDIRVNDSKSILVSKEKLSPPLIFNTATPESYINIDGNNYKGKFKITVEENKLNIIEYVELEKYVTGVLGPEMGSSWPIEALKAQAVAARTYALTLIDRTKPYDLTNTTKHQAYTGINNISPKIISAVKETEGKVLTYRNKIFRTYYHSNCGGRTTTPSGAWDIKIIKPLRGVKDPYCKYGKHFIWNNYISNYDLINFLDKKNIKKIYSLKIYTKDRSGRTIKFILRTDAGKFKIEASKLRSFFGEDKLKSTLITRIVKLSKGFKIYGRGWGHGVGLCQEGAKVMADKGWSYEKILRFYYPGSEIKNIEDVDLEI